MGIKFAPKAGQVLICDFSGYVQPEICKRRPVVIISPNGLRRPQLVTVVPLSTTPPKPVELYHYKLTANPIPGDPAGEVWAKCDLVATVRFARLDRFMLGNRNWQTGAVSMSQVRAIRLGVTRSVGIDPADPLTYTGDDSGSSG